MPQKVMIDADPGISDALAIAMALADPELDVVALTAVGGRVSAAQAGRNLMTLVEVVDPPKFPRIGVADSPDAEFERARFGEFYGEDADQDRRLQGEFGLGDWPVGDAELHHPRSAAKLLVETTRESPGEITLITLGPLTTVALALDLDPEFPARLKGLVSFAGTLDGTGDITPAAEFNVCFNPEAAKRVLRFPTTKTLLPLNVARKGVLTFDRVQQLRFDEVIPCGRLRRSLLGYALRAQHEQLGMEGLWMHDLAAIAAVSRPQLFTRQNLGVDVETGGTLSRGATIFDRRPRPRWRPNIDVLTDVDVQGLLDYVAATLTRPV